MGCACLVKLSRPGYRRGIQAGGGQQSRAEDDSYFLHFQQVYLVIKRMVKRFDCKYNIKRCIPGQKPSNYSAKPQFPTKKSVSLRQ